MGRDERATDDGSGVDLSTLTYTELYTLVKSDTEVDLRGLQHRWSKKADDLQERANFLHRAAAAMPSHWSGAAGTAFARHLSAEAKSYEDSARVLYHNSNVLGAAATSLTDAQQRFNELEAQGWPQPEGTPDGAGVWRDPKDDPRQKEAYRTVINLSSEYLNHRAQLQDPIWATPHSDTGTDLPPSGYPPVPADSPSGSGDQQPGVATSNPSDGVVSHDPGPVLAGTPPATTVPPTEVTGTSPNPGASGVPPRAGGVPLIGQPGGSALNVPFGGPGANKTVATPGTSHAITRASGANTSAGPRGAAPPSSGGGMPPSAAGGPPPKDERRGRGTDLKEDPEFWTQGIDKGAPPLVGRNRYAAPLTDDDDIVVPIDVREVQAQVSGNVPVGEHRMTTEGGTFEVRVTRGGA